MSINGLQDIECIPEQYSYGEQVLVFERLPTGWSIFEVLDESGWKFQCDCLAKANPK